MLQVVKNELTRLFVGLPVMEEVSYKNLSDLLQRREVLVILQ